MNVRGVKYNGPSGVLVNGRPVMNGEVITAPPETVAEFCSRGDCEPIYEEPEEEGAPARSSEEEE